MIDTAELAELVIVRHGETEWSRSGRHTGRTEVPLTEAGRRQAEAVAAELRGRAFAAVWSSPRQRALDTCRLAGLSDRVEVCDDLAEWDYGVYEGRTSGEILAERPLWSLWNDGCPGGESPEDVAARAALMVGRARAVKGSVAMFAHGHILKVIATCWIGEPVTFAAKLASLATGSVSVLGEEKAVPVIRSWAGA